ncbi:PAS domain S-box protein [Chloroflexota bacterium]
MQHFTIVSLVASIVALVLAGFIWFKKPTNVVNRVLSVSFILVTYCLFTEFGYRHTDNLEIAHFWLKAGSIWPLVLATLLHFALAFTGQSKLLKNSLTYVLLYIPALAISLVDLTTNLIVADFTMTKWGWICVYSESFVSDVVALWVIAIAVWATYLCWRYYFKTAGQSMRQQIKYVAIGISFAMIVGWLISEVLLPWLEVSFPGLGMPAVAIGGIFIVYAIWKHGFLSLTSEIAAEKVLSTMSDFLFLVNAQGKVVRANQAALRVLGYEEKELAGQDVRNLLTEDIPEEVLPEEVRLTDKSIMDVITVSATSLKTKAGKVIPVSISVSTVYGEDDSLVGILYVARDISKRKQAEEKLIKSEEQYRFISENTSDVITIITFDLNPVFIYVSPSIQTYGYEPEELIGKHCFDIIHLDDKEQLFSLLKHYVTAKVEGLLTGRESPIIEAIEFQARDKSGNWYHMHGTTNIVGNQILIINRDITKRKQAEEALEESYKRYKDLADFLPQAVFETDEVGNITFANRIIFETSGYTSEDVDKGIHGLQLIIPEDRDRFNEYMSRIMRGEAPGSIEITALNKDGNTFPAIILARRIIDGGKPVGARGAVVDITERKKTEEKIKELYEHEKELRHNLEDEIKRRIEFTRALVHELKTPLTPILAASEMLIDEVQEGRLVRLMTSIHRGASTMNTRIDTLLDLARGELEVLELKYSEVEPLELFNKVYDGMSPIASNRGISLVLDVQFPLPPFRADENRLEQVILNLLTNAFKWSPHGGKVTLRAKEKDTTLVVEVQDTGAGIAKENKQKIFEAYYRVESDRQTLDGLGLGLALCKTIVEAHEGKIWVESEMGKGSTFSFSIPFKTTHDGKHD